MDAWLPLICEYAADAHWILFCLLILAGINIPISEDLILLTGGALAATCIPEQKWHLYSWIFVGCWVSAWEAYWIGRLLGPKLSNYRWFNRILPPDRVVRLNYYFEKFGILTFIVGRFIPGGVRNALFMTSGLGKMPFAIFVFRDTIACIISSLTIFTIGYEFAEHYQAIVGVFKTYNWVIIAAFGTILLLVGFYRRYREESKVSS